MKRFIISVLGVSVFFVGLSGLIKTVSAKFMQDEKAVEVMRLARTAIGSGQNLTDVKSMSIKGSVTKFTEKKGITDTVLGGVEINFQMPGHFSKAFKFGNPGNGDVDGEIRKEIDVIVTDKDGNVDLTAVPTGGTKVFVRKKGDGDLEWTAEEDIRVSKDGDRVIIRKDDGTIEELKTDGRHKVIVREKGDGDSVVWTPKGNEKVIIMERKDGQDNPQLLSKKEDGKLVRKKHLAHFGNRAAGGGEMLRTTIGLLMSAPGNSKVAYKYAGRGDVDGYPSNIISVSGPGTSFKVYVDASTNLPRMISYLGHRGNVFFHKGHKADITKSALIEMKKKMAEPVEHQIRFSDFRSVGGLMLPHRWSESVGGRDSQIIDITSYEINPADILDRFKNRKTFFRKMKPATK